MKKLRQATPEDVGLIYATWLRSTYYGSTYFKLIEKDIFFDNYKNIVAARLNNSTVTICCLESDEDVVLGYSVHTGDVLHWVYVKRAWRRLGIARSLVPTSTKEVSSMTKLGRLANKSRYAFNPFKG